MDDYGSYQTELIGYDQESRERSRRFSLLQNNDLANHIFNVIYGHSPSPSQDPIDQVFDDKLQIIRSKIELILLQLYQRKKINRKVLYHLDLDGCKLQNLLFEMGEKAYGIGSERLTLERIRFDLDRQKRMEEENYFRDTGLLNKDLRDTLIQYLEEKQKCSMIGQEGGI